MNPDLSTGTRLARYEILSKLGAGGMGEVYLAEDIRLHRKVALKVLPREVASNHDRMRRFNQEATAAAGLNHPSIAHIYELDEADGVNFIAMEFVDGVTLRQKIHREEITLPKLLKYLQDVAEGLAVAHAAGIVHRDLKPDNVMVTRDGRAKILDFGLAKLIEAQPSVGNTSSEVATAVMPHHSVPGTVLGTVGYMSPEQAQGKTNEINHRSDIFSFGCILFEAATGRRAFEGKDALDSLHKIVHAPTPQIKEFNADAPAELQRIVRRCLAKEPDRRYQSIKDVAIELEELQQEWKGDVENEDAVRSASASSATSTARAFAETSAPRAQTTEIASPIEATRLLSSAEYIVSEIKRHKTGALVALGLLLAVVIGAGYGLYKFTAMKIPAAHFQQVKLTKLTTVGNVDSVIISPDGRFVSYTLTEAKKQSLWTKYLPTGSIVQIVAPAEFKALGYSTFSPDGNFIFYAVFNDENPKGTLFRTPVLGGPTKKILEHIISPITFSPDGKQFAYMRVQVVSYTGELCIANTDGSNHRILAATSANNGEWFSYSGPAWSPEGKVIAIGTGSAEGGEKMTVSTVTVDTGKTTPLTTPIWAEVKRIAWFSDGSGFIVNARELATVRTQIWQVAYPSGEARRITSDLNRYGDISLGITADNKTIATMSLESPADIWLVPSNAPDRAHAKQVTSHGQQANGFYGVAWTPNGRLVYNSFATGNGDIWIMKSDGTEQKQLTDDPQFNALPAISPDGRYIVFQSMRTGNRNLWRMSLDGLNLKQLTSGAYDGTPAFTPDGQSIIYDAREGNDFGVLKIPIDGGAPVRLAGKLSGPGPVVSPDGKLIACLNFSEENGKFICKINLLSITGGDAVKSFATQITDTGENSYLRWTADGRAVVYLGVQIIGGPAQLWRQSLDGGPPTLYADFSPASIYSFAFSHDGRQLAVSLGQETKDAVLISEE